MSSELRGRVRSRVGNLARLFSEARQADPRLVPLVAAVGVGVLAVCLVAGVLLDALVLLAVLGVLLGLLAAAQVFAWRATRHAYANLEGQPGAAAAVLSSMRGWRVTPAVTFSRRQDVVHRVVGRPGVVLVGEGAPAKTTALLRQERRRIARVVGDTPVHEVLVGEGDGRVPLRALQAHLRRLPRALKRDGVDELDTRLNALGGTSMPMPKGPVPRGRPR